MTGAYLLDEFRLTMLDIESQPVAVEMVPLEIEQARELLEICGFESAVRNADMAAIFSKALGVPVEVNPESIGLDGKPLTIVGLYCGPPRREGGIVLPFGARIQWLAVRYASGPRDVST